MRISPDAKSDVQNLLELIAKTGAFQYSPNKPFQLASGETTPYYFDLRRLCGDPAGINTVARIFYDRIRQLPEIKSVGGLESGSISMATAISQLSWLENRKNPSNPLVTSFFVRKKPKSHGTQKLIEGRLISPTVVIDDVITSGMSAMSAIKAITEEKFECKCLIGIVFRGTEQHHLEIEKHIPLQYIFDKEHLVEHFKEPAE